MIKDLVRFLSFIVQVIVEEGEEICSSLEQRVLEGFQRRGPRRCNSRESLVRYCVARWRLVTAEACCNLQIEVVTRRPNAYDQEIINLRTFGV